MLKSPGKTKELGLVMVVFLVASLIPLCQDSMLLLVCLDRLPGFALHATTGEPTVAEHPLSKPVYDTISWESSQAFLAAQQKHNTYVRLAAYQTIFPCQLYDEDANFAHAAAIIKGTVLAPGMVFSMNHTAGPYSTGRGYREGPIYIGNRLARGVGGGVCKMATTLYNAAVLADLPIVERRPHGMLVPYANPGQDATVAYGKVDLRFLNNTQSSILMWSELVDTTLFVGIYGSRQSPKVTWHHEVLHVQQRPVIYRENPLLMQGEEKVLVEGADGIAVKSWVVVEYVDGRVKQRPMGIDYYRPMARVVEIGRGTR